MQLIGDLEIVVVNHGRASFLKLVIGQQTPSSIFRQTMNEFETCPITVAVIVVAKPVFVSLPSVGAKFGAFGDVSTLDYDPIVDFWRVLVVSLWLDFYRDVRLNFR